ncbi:MAG TPA: hypothetical protein VFS10_18555 [Pyrinomonadaceae bacterium]|nr:hypothetical protein [Pyrinomonadaceae bacterium]
MIKGLCFSRARRAASLLVLLLVTCGAASRAELPPNVYKDLQAKSPEALVIKVLSVETKETDEPRLVRVSVTVKARVERVNRTNSGLKPGAAIRIRYEHRRHRAPMAGPSEVPVLKRGEVYPAYLRKAEAGDYSPAARGYSFQTVD